MPGSHLRKDVSESTRERDSLQWIDAIVDALSNDLPILRPIAHYDHDHPLRTHTSVDFHGALRDLSQLYECSTYQSLDAFALHHRTGRITTADIEHCLSSNVDRLDGAEVTPLGLRFDVRLQMLLTPEHPLASSNPEWLECLCDAHDETMPRIAEADLDAFECWLDSLRKHPSSRHRGLLRALKLSRRGVTARPCDKQHLLDTWRETMRALCERAVVNWQPPHGEFTPRLRRPLVAEHQSLITSTLSRFCRSFADPGVATWSLPHREHGFFEAFMRLYCSSDRWSSWTMPRWQRTLSALARAHIDRRVAPQQVIADFVQWARLTEREAKLYIQDALISIRGWAGLLQQLGQGDVRAARAVGQFDLVELVAALLTLDRAVLSDKFGEGIGKLALGSLSLARHRECEQRKKHLKVATRQFWLYRLVGALRLSPMQLAGFTSIDWAAIHHELNSFSLEQRQSVLQEAYENRFRAQTLKDLRADIVASNESRSTSHRQDVPGDKAFDERPRLQLLACVEPTEESYRRCVEAMVEGAQTFGVPGFFNVDMLFKPADALHPTRQVPPHVRARHLVEETIYQALSDDRIARTMAVSSLLPNAAATGNSAGLPGFSIEQMACIVARLLEDAGLTRGFARLVVVMGHESSSKNNPFEAADNCSFCGKHSSRANVLSFVQMANDYRVRKLLEQQNVHIPDDCQFLGAVRNSCNDSIEFVQLDRLPMTHADDFRHAAVCLEQAAACNTRQRTQRLFGTDLGSDARALAHCDDRMLGGATANPEWGSAGNALCVIGPRRWTSQKNLEGRAFLVSYDRHHDDAEQSILARLLRVVVPVCTRINLDYYFSAVVPDIFGAGPKAELNIDALMGVSSLSTEATSLSEDGNEAVDLRAGDLRTGLPREMVEHHEPMRLLTLIDAPRAVMSTILSDHPSLGQIFCNRHARLVAVEGGQFYELESAGVFRLIPAPD